jgi:hypothetical protein
MISKHFFNLIECYSEQGVCYLGNQEFNPILLFAFYLGIIILALTLTILFFIKFGRPSNWFRSLHY